MNSIKESFRKAYLMILMLMMITSSVAYAQKYHWQVQNAKVEATGDLQWKPEPFHFSVKGAENIRYIDYESGSDENDGKSKNSSWKHHPWDFRASGQAAKEKGIKTYVFKKGVTYRIFSYGNTAFLKASESGAENNPIRLTVDPEWGEGEAVIAGSQLITSAWKQASADDVPKRMNPENIWFTEINMPLSPQQELPPSVRENFMIFRNAGSKMAEMVLFELTPDDEIIDLHIASDAGWHVSNPNFIMHHWNMWDGQLNRNEGKNGQEDIQGFDDKLIGFESDYFDGGTLWSQYGGLMGTPTSSIIKQGDYDPEKGVLAFRTRKQPVYKGVRYLVENLPQFLDKPGEYYFVDNFKDKKGRLFLRLPDDRNPNHSQIELASAWNSIVIHNQNHIEISGLSFRFNGRKGAVIDLANNSSNIAIKNCTFDHIANDGIYGRVNANEKMDNIQVSDCDFTWINGGTAIMLQGNSGNIKSGEALGILNHVKVLRNRAQYTGIYRHNDSPWSNVPAIGVDYCRIGEVSGNITFMSFGTGIVTQGGKSGKDGRGDYIPLIRIFVNHNKIEYTALGLNDYGGLSLWQHGTIYSYSNIVGNAVGHWPGGFRGQRTINLSYPIYLDAGFKVYNFNNISWARPYQEDDPYTSTASAYFNVFGYLNPFINNTVYGSGVALGGTSGNRNDYLGNIFTNITKNFIDVNHGGNPSLIGGDDPGTSGIDGATTLAYGHNIFYGTARAGTVATIRQGAKKDLDSDDFDELKSQMQGYPLRYAQLGQKVNKQPLTKTLPVKVDPVAGEGDFRPAPGSEAIDNGIRYFVPWSLYATIGEWYFNENHSNPALVLDYHHFPTPVYFDRSMYYKVPVFELEVNEAKTDDYIESESESWAKGALVFNGQRFARIPDIKMKSDVLININDWSRRDALPPAPWVAPEPAGFNENGRAQYTDDQYLRYPGEHRKTPDMSTNNFLLEAIIKIDKDLKYGGIMGKHDGATGYKLVINEKGKVEFIVSTNDKNVSVISKVKINDDKWHHIIAEIDRQNRIMTVYIDGKISGQNKIDLDDTESLSNNADFLVGRDNDGKYYIRGAVDFMRISLGTLADAETDISELYEWQTNGPVRYDFAGNDPKGKRDVGALERLD